MFDLYLLSVEDVKPEETALPESPEIVVFASFTNVGKFPPRISALGEMADTSERLRQVSTVSSLHNYGYWFCLHSFSYIYHFIEQHITPIPTPCVVEADERLPLREAPARGSDPSLEAHQTACSQGSTDRRTASRTGGSKTNTVYQD